MCCFVRSFHTEIKSRVYSFHAKPTLSPSNGLNLTSSLTHLSAFASKTSHTLFAPLFTHTGLDGHSHFESIVFFDTVTFERTINEDIRTVNKRNHPGWNELIVFDLKFQCFNGRRRINIVCGVSNKNLHDW